MLALLGAPLTLGCSQPANQPDVGGRVNIRLKAAKLDDKVKVDWKKDEQAVHLSGNVDSAAEKARAEELAQKAVTTSGRVVGLIRSRGHHPKGGYDGQNGIRQARATGTAAVL